MTSRRTSRGLTLVEILVVMLLIAITAAAAMPTVTSMVGRGRVENIAAELVSMAQWSRTEAIRRQQKVTMLTSADGRRLGAYLYAGTALQQQLRLVTTATNTLVTASIVLPFQSDRGFTLPTPTTITVSNSSTDATLSVIVNSAGLASICAPGGGFPGYPAC